MPFRISSGSSRFNVTRTKAIKSLTGKGTVGINRFKPVHPYSANSVTWLLPGDLLNDPQGAHSGYRRPARARSGEDDRAGRPSLSSVALDPAADRLALVCGAHPDQRQDMQDHAPGGRARPEGRSHEDARDPRGDRQRSGPSRRPSGAQGTRPGHGGGVDREVPRAPAEAAQQDMAAD